MQGHYLSDAAATSYEALLFKVIDRSILERMAIRPVTISLVSISRLELAYDMISQYMVPISEAVVAMIVLS